MTEFDEGLLAAHWEAIPKHIGSGGERERIVADGWAVVDADEVQVRTVGPTRRSALVNWLYAERGHRITEAHDDLAIEKIWQTEQAITGATVRTVLIRADAIESGAHLIAAALSAARREERELCAKIADAATRNIEAFENDALYPSILGRNEAAKEIASAIRSPDGIPK